MADIDFNRMNELKNLIGNKQATEAEKKEYMKILLDNGNITQGQYDAFIKNENSDDILKAGLTIGGIVLLTWLVSKFLESK